MPRKVFQYTLSDQLFPVRKNYLTKLRLENLIDYYLQKTQNSRANDC